MTSLLKKPILVLGIGLSLTLWFLHSLQDSLSHWDNFLWITLPILGLTIGWLKHRSSRPILPPSSPSLAREQVEKNIQETTLILQQFLQESSDPSSILPLQSTLTQLNENLERKKLHGLITGGKNVGKTSLISQLQSSIHLPEPYQITLEETSPLFTENSPPINSINADIVLFIIAGDLTDSELKILSQLQSLGQRFLLILNKQDQYLPPQQAQILHQLHQRLTGIIKHQDILPISVNPHPIKVRQHQPDGTYKEWIENQSPQLNSLTNRFTEIITQEAQQLVWAHTLRQTNQLQSTLKDSLNQVRKNRALPLIEQYQWLSATTAFLNPLPSLDLLATAAISTQLIIDLGAIYQQKFSLEQAKKIALTLGTQMIKLGLVELSTQTITTLLKTNTITFLAGGAVQGISAAYLTRLAGLSLIESFQNQEILPNSSQPIKIEHLTQTLQHIFQENQQITLLQSFIKQGINHLFPQSSPPLFPNP